MIEGVRHGLTNPDIAHRQGVSIDAVKYHVANALQKLGFRSRADLRAWNGVRRDSTLLRKETTMDSNPISGTIGQIARTVSDIAAAREWYEHILGLTHLYSFGNLAFFDCGGVRLLLSAGDGTSGASILYFTVSDIHASQAAMEAGGVRFTHAPHMIHRHDDGAEEWMAFFEDNEARPLGIMARYRSAQF